MLSVLHIGQDTNHESILEIEDVAARCNNPEAFPSLRTYTLYLLPGRTGEPPEAIRSPGMAYVRNNNGIIIAQYKIDKPLLNAVE